MVRSPRVLGWSLGLLAAAALLAVGVWRAGRGNPGPQPTDAPATAASPAADDAWPMWRGDPQQRGVARVGPAGLAPRWTLAWRFKAGDAVKSSPVIAQGLVFVGSDDGQVYALDLNTGARRWAFARPPATASAPGPEPVEAPPMYLEGVVYVGDSAGVLHALEAASGTRKWSFATGDKILGSANWFAAGDGGRRILVGSYDNRLYCLDTRGQLAWSYETGNYINGSPAVAGGRAVFGGCDNLLHVVDLASGQRLREVDLDAYIGASAAIAGDTAYVGHYGNAFVAVDLRTGGIAWRFKDRDKPYFSSPAVTDELVVFGGRDRRLHCLRRSDGTPVWSFQARDDVDSSPVIAGDKVVVGADDGRVYLLRLADGQAVWQYEVGAAIKGAPAVTERCIIVGDEEGGVYAFRPATAR